MEGLAGAASIVAVVQVADRILTLCGKYALAVKDAKKDVERFTIEVESLGNVLKRFDEMAKGDGVKLCTSRSAADELDGIIQGCRSTLCKLEAQLAPKTPHGLMSRFGARALKWPFKSKEVTNTIEVLNRHKCTIILALNLDQSTNFGLVEQDRQIDKLPCADDAAFNSQLWEQQPQCLPNTRVQLRRMIEAWSNSPNSACIFWLRGMAGTGKSTIARTVADSFAKEKQLGASFFFSRGRGDLGYAKKFFTTIAAQLASKDPCLRYHISKAISENPQIIREGLGEQWKHLIVRPLLQLEEISPQPQTLVLVVDALDECEGEDSVRLLLRLLPGIRGFRSVNLRIFITSRPDTPVRLGFHQMSEDAHQDFALHDIDQEITQQDIYAFLLHELEDIRKEYGLQQGWPDNQNIRLLAHRSSGLFIYAATACRFIRSAKYSLPEDCLALLLQDSSASPPDRMLDKMYTQVLEHSIIGDKDGRTRKELGVKFREITGPIVVLFDTLASTSLSKLIGSPERIVLAVLSDLHSVLDISDNKSHPIQLLHPSFRDFLLDSTRCSDLFWIDQRKTHEDLTRGCLRLMADHLKRDICGLEAPGSLSSTVSDELVRQRIPKELQYACQYWVQHLQRSKTRLYDGGEIHSFLRGHLLHWLEVLSLMGKASEAVLAVTSLESTVVADQSPSLHAFVHDAKRFSLYNRSMIAEAPLQIYCSALVFAPEKSLIREQYEKHIPIWIYRRLKVQDNWRASLQTLEGHSSLVTAVVFSPGGRLIASASHDHTVRLWDPATGALLQTLEGHSSLVITVAFSPDGRLVASASHDHTVRLWDPATGALMQTLKGHSSLVKAVAFPPDGRLIASASGDCTIRLWDPATGALMQTLEGHSNGVIAVAFPPDGKLVVSASRDSTIMLWDPATGALLWTLEGHSGWVSAVTFSPDGRLIASASNDCTVKFWDPATGALLRTLEGHSRWVNAVAFSPGGKLIASASGDRTVRLWDSSIGTLLQTLGGHAGPVTAVAFSPNGKLIASASSDRTVMLWDSLIGTLLQTLGGHAGTVDAVAFSPDGKLIASASRDSTVRLWDPAIGTPLQAPEGHLGSVNAAAFSPDGKPIESAPGDRTVGSWDLAIGAPPQTPESHSGWIKTVAFSPDGKLIASASGDCTVRLWDSATGALLRTLEGHSGSVNALAFSPDGKLIVSASHDHTARLRDLATGALLRTLEGHSGVVSAVAFSPDGKLIVSVSDDFAVKFWDLATGAPLQTFEGHFNSVNTVTFSPDSKLIALASSDSTIRLCDPVTGALMQTLGDHPGWVNAVTFSPDGKLIASASNDSTIRLWGLATGILLQTLEGHSSFVSAVAFSPDGRLIASASGDLTIRLWDPATGESLGKLETGTCVQKLLFSSDGQYLDTNMGRLDIPNPVSSRSKSTGGKGIFVNGAWVVRGTEKVLWLPPDYRATFAAVRNDVLVMGHASGRISIIGFDCSSTRFVL